MFNPSDFKRIILASDLETSYSVEFSGDEDEFTIYITANNTKDLEKKIELKLSEIFSVNIRLAKTTNNKQKYGGYDIGDENWIGWVYVKKGANNNTYSVGTNGRKTITYKALKV